MNDKLEFSLFADAGKSKPTRPEIALVEEETLKPQKAPEAFRTISEVADDLQIPQHVLRFWETRFREVSPVKRNGGRRYYRPEDIEVLKHISDLLYVKGYTIKGVQRLFAEGRDGKSADTGNEIHLSPSVVVSKENVEIPSSTQEEEISEKGGAMQTSSVELDEKDYHALWVQAQQENIKIGQKNSLLVDALQNLLVELEELRKQIKI